ncbi:hypothetical protein F9C07_5647 [Aspergillus flavus]|uniref:Uncharacterized protein n=1 Tax=Aspergillus flavus (strain ATCC 200026 / FGSC A1120 / IAM 13836 / NRRL 3357 / JCM 12722 / SRRC 167) TaxID=332952 RepID=A0A7U2R0I6_ASPFN|nr:hypothetical protein F9C07_5647 [Aspergillus flavus]
MTEPPNDFNGKQAHDHTPLLLTKTTTLGSGSMILPSLPTVSTAAPRQLQVTVPFGGGSTVDIHREL